MILQTCIRTYKLKQDQFKPLTIGEQIAIIYAAVNGLMDTVDVKRVKEFEKKLKEDQK